MCICECKICILGVCVNAYMCVSVSMPIHTCAHMFMCISCPCMHMYMNVYHFFNVCSSVLAICLCALVHGHAHACFCVGMFV